MIVRVLIFSDRLWKISPWRLVLTRKRNKTVGGDLVSKLLRSVNGTYE